MTEQQDTMISAKVTGRGEVPSLSDKKNGWVIGRTSKDKKKLGWCLADEVEDFNSSSVP